MNVDLLSTISNEKKIEILRKNWMSHDARSQMETVRLFGWKKGNKLNKSIIREMGKVMMYRLMNALRISKITNIEDLKNLCLAAMEFYYPPPAFNYRIESQSDKSILGIIEKCGTMEGIKKLGVTEQYECGCFAMRSGWYKALGMNVKEETIKCIKNGDNICEIALKVNKWSNKK